MTGPPVRSARMLPDNGVLRPGSRDDDGDGGVRGHTLELFNG